jgi:hypothetical protein
VNTFGECYLRIFLIILMIWLSTLYIFPDESDDTSIKKKIPFSQEGKINITAGIFFKYKKENVENHYPSLNNLINPGALFLSNLNYGLLFPVFNYKQEELKRRSGIGLDFNFGVAVVHLNNTISFKITPLPFYSLSFRFGTNYSWTGLLKNSPIKSQLDDIYFPPTSLTFNFIINNDLVFTPSIFVAKEYRRWTNIIFNASLAFKYSSYLAADKNNNFTSTDILADKYDGFSINANFILAYLMPVIPDSRTSGAKDKSFRTSRSFSIMPGAMLTINDFNLSHSLDSTMSVKKGWRSDFVFVTFGPLLSFNLPYNLSINISGQFKNEKRYTKDSSDLILYNREYKDWFVYFYAIAFNFGWKFL